VIAFAEVVDTSKELLTPSRITESLRNGYPAQELLMPIRIAITG
jgi:hypothetical protein